MDRKHMWVECLVICTSHEGKVRIDHRCPTVDRMHIHRGILHEMLPQPNALSDQDRTRDKRMSLRLVDRNRDRMIDKDRFQCPKIYQVDNVL